MSWLAISLLLSPLAAAHATSISRWVRPDDQEASSGGVNFWVAARATLANNFCSSHCPTHKPPFCTVSATCLNMEGAACPLQYPVTPAPNAANPCGSLGKSEMATTGVFPAAVRQAMSWLTKSPSSGNNTQITSALGVAGICAHTLACGNASSQLSLSWLSAATKRCLAWLILDPLQAI